MKKFLLIGFVGSLAVMANAQAYRVDGFKSSGVQNGDRQFLSTGFTGSSVKFDQTNIGFFGDGTLRTGGKSYGWNDNVPRDVDGSNKHLLNPDRGDKATAFSGEANGTAKLSEVFGQNNLGYLMDSEDSAVWTLDLKYRNGGFITANGGVDPELLLMERGANSKLGVRAILDNGQYSNSFILDFRTDKNGMAGKTDYSIDTLEISGAQPVSAIGLGLTAFNLAAGTKVYGYQFFVNQNSGANFNGPDFIGFVAARTAPTPVPEPTSMAMFGLSALAFFRRKRK
ncbi:MAG: exosortase-dependent surface protein XDP2 [Fimbriimonadaceae bacterium]|nr:exosortase-dependent surface protein XDP2 [Fimbriimonadaceae bacterium]